MNEKFRNIYRIPSTRLQNWDYGSNAPYFVTICTAGREHYFGEIENRIMKLNEIGLLSQKYWFEIPNHFSFVELVNFVIMPNHVHGIIVINKNNNDNVETRHCLVSTNTNTPPNQNKTFGQLRFQNQGKNTLSSIVGSFKSVVTKHARKIHADFAWQARFHDHIIRNDKSFQNIQKYIQENPKKWENDKFNLL